MQYAAAGTWIIYRYLGGQKRCPAATERRRVWGQGQGQGECAASNFFLFALPPVAELARQLSHASVLPLSPRSPFMLRSDFDTMIPL